MLKSYSQPATRQDVWVLNRLDGKEQGYFVEIGGHNGVHHSNTLLLEEHFNWKGLLVEPQTDLYIDGLRNRSSRNQFSSDVIGSNDGKEVFFLNGGSYGGISEFMPDDWLHEHKLRATKGDYRTTTSLFTLFKKHRVPQLVDYFSLDVEGAELPILEAFWKFGGDANYQFNIISIEFRYDHVLLSKLEDLLSHQYKLEHVEAFDAFFVNKRLAR